MNIKEILPPTIIKPLKKIKNRYFNRFSGENLYPRLEQLIKTNKEINELFPFKDLSQHYVYEPSRQTKEHPDVFCNQIRYYRVYNYFKTYFPEILRSETAVLDIGDTSGVLFRAMKRKGLSANINADVVSFIKSRGIDAKEGNIEQLDFADKSFDYTFCFQCLEHLPNPIKALNELSRITRKNVFISIPYVNCTKIYTKDHWQSLKKSSVADGGWSEQEVREVDGHKFEFSTSDFKKIVTHANLTCVDQFPINYFSPLGESRKSDGTYFNFFILKPIR